MRKTRFFIIGAPKCGTTSMAGWLSEHPNVFMSPIKEPHFFSSDLSNQVISSNKRYQKLFRGVAEKHLAIGEASTWYLYSQEAVPRIESEFPGARYIVMVRDPSKMALSLYRHNLRVLHEEQPTFLAAWELQDERAEGRCIPASCSEPAFLQYKEACSLGTLLERLMKTVPKERILIISLDSIKEDPRIEYSRALKFLDLPDDKRTKFPTANIARSFKYAFLQRLLRFGAKLRISLGIQRGFGLAKLNESPLSESPDTFPQFITDAFEQERQIMRKLLIEIDKQS